MPYLRAVVGTYGSAAHEQQGLVEALERSTIASGGALRSEHAWLREKVETVRKNSVVGIGKEEGEVGQKARKSPMLPERKKKVVIFGSGMVAAPAVDEIARHEDVELIVGRSFTLQSDPTLLGQG